MTRRQQIVIMMLFILLSSAVIAFALPGNVLGQMTIPTRTPTPKSDNATDPPPDPTDDNGGGNNTPNPTNPPPARSSSTPSSNATDTPIPVVGTPLATNTVQLPVSSATSTIMVIGTATPSANGTIPASSTPFGGVLAPGTTPVSFPVVATAFPTAEQCGEPPTFTTLITAIVYSGPGNEYTFIETLAADETRPIVGRAVYSPWWLIQLDGKFNQAWINDKTGVIHGNTANVPEVPAPDIDGVTPTPGIPWAPTPVNDCDLTPTVAATSSMVIVGSSTTIEEQGVSLEGESGSQSDLESDQRSIAASTAAPLDLPSSAPTPNLLPIAGLVLIIAAVFIALFLRRNPGGGESSS